MGWCHAWHIDWQRFMYWRDEIGLEPAYYKIKNEARKTRGDA